MTKPLTSYPSYARWYIGTTGLGIGVGITWTIAMTTMGMQRYITKSHAIMFLYSVSILCFIAQGWMLYRWEKRMKADRAELEKQRLELGMPSPWTKPPK